MNNDEFLWTAKYRPKTISECILPEELKRQFSVIESASGQIQNMIFSGSPGLGKTTMAMIFCEIMNCEYMLLNGSNEGRSIDTLRGTIAQFASTLSLEGKAFKVVILDEADGMAHGSSSAILDGLRSFMEDYSRTCRFIFTCNLINKIPPAIRSRCKVIDFTIPREEKPALAKQMAASCISILEKEGKQFNKIDVLTLVKNRFPDLRNIIENLQFGSYGDSFVIEHKKEYDIAPLMGYIKAKEFAKMRKWCSDNSDADFASMTKNIYSEIHLYFNNETIPLTIKIISDTIRDMYFSSHKEITFVNMCTELMALS